MDGAEFFSNCLVQATVVVKQVRPEHYANATPCDDWHVGDLLDHLLAELHGVPQLLAGKILDPKEGGDENGEIILDEADTDPSLNWQAAADAADSASYLADLDELAHTARGKVSNDIYLRQVATDLLVHAWDLAVAIGMPIVFTPDTAQVAYAYAVSTDSKLQPDDADTTPLSIDADAPTQIKLLGLYGRSSDWRAVS